MLLKHGRRRNLQFTQNQPFAKIISHLWTLLTSIFTAITPTAYLLLCYCIIRLLCRNSQHWELHHGNRDHKAKVAQSVGRGVARQGQGGGGKKKSLHMEVLSIHWARSSSPVLQQLPARLVSVNKPSAKVKENCKKDIMQTVISVDPAEPQIEQHNPFLFVFPSESESQEGAAFSCMTGLWIQYEPSIHFDTDYFLNTKTERQHIRWHVLAVSWKEQSLFLNPSSRKSRFSFFFLWILKCRELIDSFIVNILITKTHFEDFSLVSSSKIVRTSHTWLLSYLLNERGGQIGQRPPSQIYCPVNVTGLINKF